MSATDRAVTATMNYAAPDGGRATYDILHYERAPLPLRPERVVVSDARAAETAPTLEREGFTIVSAPTDVTDFTDAGQIRDRYLPAVAAAIKAAYGADHVWMSPGPVIRATAPRDRQARETPDAARFLHLDYSDASAHEFIKQSVGYDPEIAARYPCIHAVNTWRSITPAPQDVPLAMCDKRTSALADLVTADADYKSAATPFKFEISLVRHNPRHRWSYFPAMSPDELLVFKGWDLGPEPTPSVLHGAFVDDDVPDDVPPRISIEARGFALLRD